MKFQHVSDKPRKGQLGVVQLTMITYFLVCAGPYGIEEAVQATGPFMALIFIVAVPIFLSFPLSLICSEMGSIFPQTGSTIMWALDIVHGLKQQLNATTDLEALQQLTDEGQGAKTLAAEKKKLTKQFGFSKFVAQLSANTLLLKAVVDNAMYPTMICDYLHTFFPALDVWYWRIIVAAISFTCVAVLNFFGIDVVGWAQYAFAAVVLMPIILFVIFSFPMWKAENLSPSNKPTESHLGLLLSNLIWQCTGFDQTTNLSGEVWRPQRTFPIALSMVVLLVIASYVIPVVAGAMVQPNSDLWENGSFSDMSLLLPKCQNGWLRIWLTIAGAASALSVQNACVACTSRELYCNAQCDLLPFGQWVARLKSFRRRRIVDVDDNPNSLNLAYQVEDDMELEDIGLVPHRAIMVVSAAPVVLLVFPFDILVTMDAFLIAFSMLLQLGFYIYAKHGKYGHYARHPAAGQTFHIGGGKLITALVVMLPVLVVGVLVVTQGWLPAVLTTGCQLLLFALLFIQTRRDKRRLERSQQEPPIPK